MNFNKCSRCGNFFSSNNPTCPSCATKDKLEMDTLKTYLSNNPAIMDNITSKYSYISKDTGITVSNLTRFLNNSNFATGLNSNIDSTNINL